MAKIERFEEIRSWQLAKGLVMEVYRMSGNGRFAKDFGLREFQRFLCMAKGSAAELRSHLFAAEIRNI